MQTPDTIGYMIAGYVAMTAILVIYVFSLVVRWNHLRQQLRNHQMRARKE